MNLFAGSRSSESDRLGNHDDLRGAVSCAAEISWQTAVPAGAGDGPTKITPDPGRLPSEKLFLSKLMPFLPKHHSHNVKQPTKPPKFHWAALLLKSGLASPFFISFPHLRLSNSHKQLKNPDRLATVSEYPRKNHDHDQT